MTTIPKARVVRDLDHPDFPHKTALGYSRGCTRECCLAAERREDKLREYRRANGILSPAKITQRESAQLAARIATLTTRHRLTLHAIRLATGLGRDTLARARDGRPTSRKSFERIMALRPNDVTLRTVQPADPTVLRVDQMLALGYPMSWQAKQVETHIKSVVTMVSRFRLGQQKYVEPETAARFEDLAARIGDNPADPERDGIAAREIARAKSIARRHGAYPPVFYNEDGTLNWRAIPDHPWSIVDEGCHTRIERLRAALQNPDCGAKSLATLEYGRAPIDDRDDPDYEADAHREYEAITMAYRRLLTNLGLRTKNDPTLPQRREDLKQALWRFDRLGESTPVSFCINNGILELFSSEVPSDHPDVAEARAEHRAGILKARRERRRASRAAASKAAA